MSPTTLLYNFSIEFGFLPRFVLCTEAEKETPKGKKPKITSGLAKAAGSSKVAELSDEDLEQTLAGSVELLKDPMAQENLDGIGAHKKAVKKSKAKAKAEGKSVARPKKKAPNKDMLVLASS